MHMTEFMHPDTQDLMRQRGLEPQYWKREWDDPAAAVQLWDDRMYPPFFNQLTDDTKRHFLGVQSLTNPSQLTIRTWNRDTGQWRKKRCFLKPPPLQTGGMAQANLYLVTAPSF